MSLNTLPFEIIVKIWLHLPHPSHVALSRVAKHFYLLSKSREFLRRWFISQVIHEPLDIRELQWSALQKSCQNYGGRVEKISVPPIWGYREIFSIPSCPLISVSGFSWCKFLHYVRENGTTSVPEITDITKVICFEDKAFFLSRDGKLISYDYHYHWITEEETDVVDIAGHDRTLVILHDYGCISYRNFGEDREGDVLEIENVIKLDDWGETVLTSDDTIAYGPYFDFHNTFHLGTIITASVVRFNCNCLLTDEGCLYVVVYPGIDFSETLDLPCLSFPSLDNPRIIDAVHWDKYEIIITECGDAYAFTLLHPYPYDNEGGLERWPPSEEYFSITDLIYLGSGAKRIHQVGRFLALAF